MAKKFEKPLKDLRRERDALNSIISKIEKGPIRIIDVACEHIERHHKFEILRVEGNPKKDKTWSQLERIFCKSKCPQCPHGDFNYKYSKGKNGCVQIKLTGEAVFNFESLERMRKEAIKHPPVRGEFILEK